MKRHRLAWVVVGLVLAGCTPKGQARSAKAQASPPPLPDDVQGVAAAASPAGAAAAGARPGGLSATGEFVSPARSELASKVTGRVGRILADEGARVKKGDPLLELETDYFKLEQQRAEGEAGRARAAAEEAGRDLDRKQGLIAKGSVPQAVFDRSRAASEQAQAGKAAAEATLALARQRLADAVLVSPLDGVVMERRVDVGERLGDSTVAFIVVQTAPLKLRFRVPERYLSQVKRGQPVKALVDPYPGEAFEGRVSVVVQAMDPASRTFGVEAEFGNRDGRLTPGLFARVELDLGSTPAVAGGERAQAR